MFLLRQRGINMNEERDDLLAAFENPDMNIEAVQETPVAPAMETPVAPAMPEAPVAPVMPEAPVMPAATEVPAMETPVAPVMPEAPVAPAMPEAPVMPVAPEVPAMETPVAPVMPEAPVAPQEPVMPAQNIDVVSTENLMAPEFQTPEAEPVAPAMQAAPVMETAPVVDAAPVVENQATEEETAPVVDADPSIGVKQELKNDVNDEDPNFLKKNIKFILILCAVIAVFIIFLPKVLSLLSGGKYQKKTSLCSF